MRAAKNNYRMIERIFFLLANPDVKGKEYCERWEVSFNTYFRDKRFVRVSLEGYKVITYKL